MKGLSFAAQIKYLEETVGQRADRTTGPRLSRLRVKAVGGTLAGTQNSKVEELGAS